MKHIKYALLGLGIISVVAVFLPYLTIESVSFSLWDAGKLASSTGESAAPVYAILACALAIAGVAGFAIKKQQLTRLSAGIAMLLCVAILVCLVTVGGGGDEGILEHASIGCYILLFGPLVGFVAGFVGLVKAERGPQQL